MGNIDVALFTAARDGDVLALKEALMRGANPNSIIKEEEGVPAPLHIAALLETSSSIACTETLLQHGADVNVMLISNRNTPLHVAVSIGAIDVCKVLLIAGASICGNAFGNTPLHSAARNGNEAIVRLLLDEPKVDVNATNNRGSTALHLCCFLTSSSDDKYKESSKTENGMERSDKADCFVRIATLLLNNRIDVNAIDVNGYTALHVASQFGNMNMIRLLFRSGAGLAYKTISSKEGKGGRTPLQISSLYGSKEVFEFLLLAEQKQKNIGDLQQFHGGNE